MGNRKLASVNATLFVPILLRPASIGITEKQNFSDRLELKTEAVISVGVDFGTSLSLNHERGLLTSVTYLHQVVPRVTGRASGYFDAVTVTRR